MIRGLFLGLVLVTMSTAAMAQSLRVRSGEHDGYTRLVVQIPAGTAWSLRQLHNGAELDVALESVVFDTDAVFDRLSERRLTSATQAEPGSSLTLAFGCDCVATAFLHRATMVVIDIAPGQVTPLPPLDLSQPDLPKTPRKEPAIPIALPLLDLSRRELESQLMSRILQGADRDVVDLHLSDVGPRQSNVIGPMRIPGDLGDNVKISSVLDEFRDLGGLTETQMNPQPPCITDAELDFAAWSDATPFDQQVARLRRELFAEFDAIQSDRAVALAKAYTFHGFGAEAIQVLHLLPEQSPTTNRIAAIAHAMDDRPTPEPNPFAGQQRCPGEAALWAVLTEHTLQPEGELNTIEQSFAAMPPHLRRRFGPDLVEILVEADQLEASRRVLRSAKRVSDKNRPAMGLAQATIAEAEGEESKAETLLTDVAATPDTTERSALALARLVEKRWADRGALSQQNIDLAAAFAVELRNSELGPMMARTHALGLGLNQEFKVALNLIRSAPANKEWHRTHDQVLQLLAERGDDIVFLSHALTLPPKMRDALETETALSISDRLANLGFPQQAFALANRSSDTDRRAERARLRARAVMRNGRPREALLQVSDDQSDAARQIRAQALIQAREFDEAAATLQELGKAEEAARYLWLSEQEIAGDAPGKFGTLIRLEQSLSQVMERVPDKPLADAAALLEQSAQSRALITDMLNLASEASE